MLCKYYYFIIQIIHNLLLVSKEISTYILLSKPGFILRRTYTGNWSFQRTDLKVLPAFTVKFTRGLGFL